MSNIGEDRIQTNANAIKALKAFVGTSRTLATSASTVVDGVNEVRQEALGATAATVANTKAISDEEARAVKRENDLSAAIGAEAARASTKETALDTAVGQLQTDLTAQNSTFTGKFGSLEARLGDTPLPTTATQMTGAIQELHTAILTKATLTKANANTAGVEANAASIDDLGEALKTVEGIDASNHAIALQAVQTEASRAAAKETANAEAIAAETARALAAESSLRLAVQGGSGSTDLLSARVTALEGSLAALQTMVANQRTLVVANRQDMRGTDLGLFSEIIVLPGGTLVVSPAQENQIRSNLNSSEDPVAFRNDGDLEVIAAEPYDVRPDIPYLFTRLTAIAEVHMRGDQFLALSPSGIIVVEVASSLDLRSAPVGAQTTVRVLPGGEATVSPSQAQAMAGGTGVRVVALEPTDFSSLGHIVPPRVAHVVCEADCTFVDVPASMEKAAGAKVTLRVVEDKRFYDSTHTIDHRVDALDLQATATVTPAQAASYPTTKGPNGRLNVVLAGGGEFDLRPFSVAGYDALLLQGTDILVDTAQADALPSVHRDNGKVVLVVNGASLPSDAAFVHTVDVVRSVAPISLTLTQAMNVAIEYAPTVTLQLSADADLSVLPLEHVHRVESTKAVRLSHGQWKAMLSVSAAEVILTVRSAEDLRPTDLDGIDTLELFDACKAMVGQVQGKTIVGGPAHLTCYAEGTVPPSFSLQEVRTLVGTNAVISPAQFREVAAVEGGVTVLVQSVENFVGDPLEGVTLRVEGSATLTADQYKAIFLTSTGTVTVVVTGGDETLDHVHHIDTVRINAGAALTMYLDDLSSVTVHKEGGSCTGRWKRIRWRRTTRSSMGSTCWKGP